MQVIHPLWILCELRNPSKTVESDPFSMFGKRNFVESNLGLLSNPKEKKIVKKVKRNTNKFFHFIKWTENSCRYDALLAFILFFANNEGKNIFQTKINDENFQLIIKSALETSSCNLEATANSFALLCHQYEDSNYDAVNDHGSLLRLFEKIFSKNIESFNTEFIRTSVCTNKQCKDNRQRSSSIFGPLCIINTGDFVSRSDYILESWFEKVYKHTRIKQECANCIDQAIKTNQKQKSRSQITITDKLSKLPQYLLLNCESLSNNVEEVSCISTINFKIEEEFSFSFEKNDFSYELISIVLFENENHYTLSYNNPCFENKKYKGWFYYNDLLACVEKQDIVLDITELSKKDKIPLLIVYKLHRL